MFRRLVREDVGWRLLDATGHAVMAGLLPGPWWAQILPDLLLPVIWSRSYVTDELLPEKSWMIRAHKLLHTIWIPLGLLTIWIYRQPPKLVWEDTLWLTVALQYSMHIIWDQFTHRKSWHQKEWV